MWGLTSVMFPIWFYLRLVRYGLLLAGCFFVLLAGMMKWAARSRRMAAKSATPEQPLRGWKGILISPHTPTVIERVARGLIFAIGLVLGWQAHSVQQFNHTDSYRMHVVHALSPYNYLVDVNGARPFVFRVCENMSDPGFEDGEIDDVTFEESSQRDGECKSFSGTQFGWQTVRDDKGNVIHTGGQ